MSVVYLGRHAWLSLEGAVKILRTEYYNDQQSLERFEQEALTAGKLDHENIIKVLDYGQDKNNYYFMVLELLSGNDLESFIQQAPFPSRWCLEVFDQVAQALIATHQAGIIHRDLKPSNIFLMPGDPFPKVKLFDFGVAKVLFEEVDKKLTQTGMIVGTPAYLAPEQLIPKVPLTTSVDIYAFGVILYQLLTGQLPLEGDSLIEHAILILQQEPPLLGSLRPEFAGTQLEKFLSSLLAKAPSARPPNMIAVREGLIEALSSVDDPLNLEENYPVIVPAEPTTPLLHTSPAPPPPSSSSNVITPHNATQQKLPPSVDLYANTNPTPSIHTEMSEEERRREEEMLARLSAEVSAAEFIRELLGKDDDYGDDEFEETLLDGHVSLNLPPAFQNPDPIEQQPSQEDSSEQTFDTNEEASPAHFASNDSSLSPADLASINFQPIKNSPPSTSLPHHIESLDFNMPTSTPSSHEKITPQKTPFERPEPTPPPTHRPLQQRQPTPPPSPSPRQSGFYEKMERDPRQSGFYEKADSTEPAHSPPVASPSMRSVPRAEPKKRDELEQRRRERAARSSTNIKKIDSKEQRQQRFGTGTFHRQSAPNDKAIDDSSSKRGVVVVGKRGTTSSPSIASPKREKLTPSPSLSGQNVPIIKDSPRDPLSGERISSKKFQEKKSQEPHKASSRHSSPRITALSRKEVNEKIAASQHPSSINRSPRSSLKKERSQFPQEEKKSFPFFIWILLLLVGLITFFLLHFFVISHKSHSSLQPPSTHYALEQSPEFPKARDSTTS